MARIFGTDDSDGLDGTVQDDVVQGWQRGRAESDLGDDTLNGLGGSDELFGGGGGDILNGGVDNDRLFDDRANANFGPFAGPFFDDVLNGGGGNDLLESLGGIDTLNGGIGQDFASIERTTATADLSFDLTDLTAVTVLVGDGTRIRGVENISVEGGSGNDRFSASVGEVSFDGGGGNDTLTASTPFAWLEGGDGNDLLETGAGSDSLFDHSSFEAGNDNDRLSAGGGQDILHSWGGIDRLSGGSGRDRAEIDRTELTNDLTFIMTDPTGFTILEGNGTRVRQVENIHLFGGSGDDRFSTLGGEDNLEGGAGDDLLWGGDGDDNLFGAEGDDVLRGGGGSDLLYGDLTLDEDEGREKLFGGAGQDYLNCWGGADTIDGGSGFDEGYIDRARATEALSFHLADIGAFATLVGDGTQIRGVELLQLVGGSGDDTFSAIAGRMHFHGRGGDDALSGGAGRDTLRGDEGGDTLNGGAGNDELVCGFARRGGDDAADVLRFEGGFGDDTVEQFEDGSDRLEFVGFTEADLTIEVFRRTVTVTLDNGEDAGTVTIGDFSRFGVFDEDDYFFT